jgi:hypothetical protein
MSKNIKIQLLIFSVLTILGIAYWIMFDFLRWDMFDSPSFVGAARQMFGLEGGFNMQSRLSKPLVLIIPGFIEYMTGLHAQYGFLLQTVFAYYGCGFLIYRIGFRLFGNERIAFMGMLIYVMCQPFAIFSMMILVDAVGWFISLMIIDQAIKYGSEKEYKLAPWLLLSIASALGLLAKESVIFSFFFLVFYQFQLLKNWISRIIHVAASGFVFVLTFAFSQWLTQQLFDDSIVGRLFSQQERVGFVYYNAGNAAQIFRIIDYYWFLVLVGVFSFIKSFNKDTIQTEVLAFGAAIIISILLMPLYPFVVDRILFMVAPGLVIFALISYRILGKTLLPLIIIGGIMNIMTAWLIYMYDIKGLLKWGLILYVGLILALIIYKKKSIRLLK